MIDIVFPDGNEKQFIEMAKKLGYSGLCFIYTAVKKTDIKSDIEIFNGVLCKNKLKKADFVLLESNNRVLLKKKPNAIINIEGERDFIHQRDSGLDQVICKEMHKYGVKYAVPFSAILNSDDKARLLGRVIQNIRLCKKYKVDVLIASFAEKPYEMRNAQDLIAFSRTLGCQKPLVLNRKNIKTD
jgi:RNase P/RNase MRP subunit p30